MPVVALMLLALFNVLQVRCSSAGQLMWLFPMPESRPRLHR